MPCHRGSSGLTYTVFYSIWTLRAKGRRVSPPGEVHILISEPVTTYQETDVVKNLEMEDCWGLSEPNIITKLLGRKAGRQESERKG